MASRRHAKDSRASRGLEVVRISTIVMIGFAVLFGLLAVFVTQSWLNSQAEMMRARNQQTNQKPVETQTIVVASRPLRFGAELNGSSLREIAWPGDAVPAGAFATISDLTAGGRRRVLTALQANGAVPGAQSNRPGPGGHPGARAAE